MLTRLKVSNFKNLVDVDLYLGPFTCVVGPNGVGKSNLFDAIRFLSALANHTLMEAAAAVRDQDSRTAPVRDLFHRVGDHYAERITFEAEMIVPRRAIDDLGQEAEASITFLRYSLELAYRETDDSLVRGNLAIVKEELSISPTRLPPTSFISSQRKGLAQIRSVRQAPRSLFHFNYRRGRKQSHKTTSGWRQQRSSFAPIGR